MRVAVLFTGGKDSVLALYMARKIGHEIVCTVTIRAPAESYMFHHPNIDLAALASQAIGIPNVQKMSEGVKEEELKDLEAALAGLDVEGVVSGAIASQYQKSRIEAICKRLGLETINPLWGMDPKTVLEKTVELGFDTIITAVAADGFDQSWLGRHIDRACIQELEKLRERYRIHMAFEGGEAETLVLSCLLYQGKRITIADTETVWDGSSGMLLIRKATLADTAENKL